MQRALLIADKDAGKLLLIGDSLVFNGKQLKVREELPEGVAKKVAKEEVTSSKMFVPRGARPRAGLGSSKKSVAATSAPSSVSNIASSSKSGKGQDDFRKLL